jgi:hypothetical protein
MSRMNPSPLFLLNRPLILSLPCRSGTDKNGASTLDLLFRAGTGKKDEFLFCDIALNLVVTGPTPDG